MRCPIAVEFASLCCGPNLGAVDDLDALLSLERRRVARFDRLPWGPEGEVTYCIQPRGDRSGLVAQLRELAARNPQANNRPAPTVHLDYTFRR